MSKMSEISALLDEIRSCSNTLISIYDELHELIGSQEQEEEKAKTKGTRRKKTKAICRRPVIMKKKNINGQSEFKPQREPFRRKTIKGMTAHFPRCS